MTKTGLDGSIVSIFINNIKIITLKNSKIIKHIILKLTFPVFIIDLGQIRFFLSLKIEQNWGKQVFKILQLAYIKKVLNKFYLNKAYAINTLIKKTAFFKQKIKRGALSSKKKCY